MKDIGDAEFERRVKKINRDCFMTFFPFISAIGIGIISLVIYFYQQQRTDTKALLDLTTDNYSTIREIKVHQEVQGKDIEALNKKVFRK